MEPIRIAGPWITQKEIEYVTDAVTNAWYGNAGMYHQRLERAFAEYHSVQYALALPSCTSAIHLALLALGIGPGDEVIVPDITWTASAAPIMYVGAKPVFADIEPDTWCLSVESFKSCITPHTKAVIAVDLYGNLPDMDALIFVAKQHGIAVIEDAAEAVGSEYHGRKAGSMGNIGVYSFHGTKTLTTGEGGMLITDEKNLYDRAVFFGDHGRKPGDRSFRHESIGYKYKMSSLQAALGLAQLERLDELVERKRQIFKSYKAELASIDGIQMNCEFRGIKNSYWMTTIVWDKDYGIQKEEFIRQMNEAAMDCRPFFYPLSSLPAYKEYIDAEQYRHRNRFSYEISPYSVNLPSAMNVTDDQINRVCNRVREILYKK